MKHNLEKLVEKLRSELEQLFKEKNDFQDPAIQAKSKELDAAINRLMECQENLLFKRNNPAGKGIIGRG